MGFSSQFFINTASKIRTMRFFGTRQLIFHNSPFAFLLCQIKEAEKNGNVIAIKCWIRLFAAALMVDLVGTNILPFLFQSLVARHGRMDFSVTNSDFVLTSLLWRRKDFLVMRGWLFLLQYFVYGQLIDFGASQIFYWNKREYSPLQWESGWLARSNTLETVVSGIEFC